MPLVQVSLRNDDLLLVYEDGLARLWDVKMREFRRSTTADKARELLLGGSWIRWFVLYQRYIPFVCG
jgi:hypothetical protein